VSNNLEQPRAFGKEPNKMSFYNTALERATEVLGDKERAVEWLEKMSNAFDKSPKEILSDQDGLDRVLRHLHSIELALDTD
jgi:uncharacterized protein (DUF2384 family)